MAVARSNFVTGEVIQNRAWTDRLYSLKIRTELKPFKAGQFVRLQLPLDGKHVAKPYSLVNSPQEPNVELLYNTVTDGQLSNALAALEAGDKIEISQPASGFFVLDEIPDSRHLWMIATGTGIGPYFSILKTEVVWQRFDKIVLVHGVAVKDELVFPELIESWQQEYSNKFHFISCVSREQNPAGLQGRVSVSLENGNLEERTGLKISKESSHVMLCGNHHMIDDMKTLLAERGMKKNLRNKPGHITTEQYF